MERESLKEIRQRVDWALARADNEIEEKIAQKEHLQKIKLDLTAHIEAEEELPPEQEPPEEEPPVEEPSEEPPVEEPDPKPEDETPEEPGEETPAIIVSEDFEQYADGDPLSGSVGPADSRFRWIGETKNTIVSSKYALTGSKSLLFPYPATPHNVDSIREQRFQIAPDIASAPSEIGLEMFVRCPDNWAFRDSTKGSNNNKFLAIWGEDYGGGNYTEPKFVWEWGWGGPEDGNAHMWMGTNERGPSGGRSEPRKGGRQNQLVKGIAFDKSMRGEWLRFRFHIKVAMAGVLDVWRDDKVIARQPADWRTLPMNGSINYLRNGYLLGWSNAGFDEATDFAIDGFKIWRGVPPWLSEMS